MRRPRGESLTAACLPIYDFVVIGVDVDDYAVCLTKGDTESLALDNSTRRRHLAFFLKLDEHDFEVFNAQSITDEFVCLSPSIRRVGCWRQNNHDVWQALLSYDFGHTLARGHQRG